MPLTLLTPSRLARIQDMLLPNAVFYLCLYIYVFALRLLAKKRFCLTLTKMNT